MEWNDTCYRAIGKYNRASIGFNIMNNSLKNYEDG